MENKIAILIIFVTTLLSCELIDKNSKSRDFEIDNFFNLFNKHFTENLKKGDLPAKSKIPKFIKQDKMTYSEKEMELSDFFYNKKEPEYFGLPQSIFYIFKEESDITSEMKVISEKEKYIFLIHINALCTFNDDENIRPDHFVINRFNIREEFQFNVKIDKNKYYIGGNNLQTLISVEKFKNLIKNLRELETIDLEARNKKESEKYEKILNHCLMKSDANIKVKNDGI